MKNLAVVLDGDDDDPIERQAGQRGDGAQEEEGGAALACAHAAAGCGCHAALAADNDDGVCRSAAHRHSLSPLLTRSRPRRDVTAAIVVHKRGQLHMSNCVVSATEQAAVICHGKGE